MAPLLPRRQSSKTAKSINVELNCSTVGTYDTGVTVARNIPKLQLKSHHLQSLVNIHKMGQRQMGQIKHRTRDSLNLQIFDSKYQSWFANFF